MDAAVIAALSKWPNVPAVFGWLQLTARGEWRIRGERIANAALQAFISRNYAADEHGRWFFQNGPQRVYVELEATPWIWRAALNQSHWQSHWQLAAHTSNDTGLLPKRLLGAWLDEAGRFVLQTDLGVGLVSSDDASHIAAALRGAHGNAIDESIFAEWTDNAASPTIDVVGSLIGLENKAPLERLRSVDLPSRFGFEPAPHPIAADKP